MLSYASRRIMVDGIRINSVCQLASLYCSFWFCLKSCLHAVFYILHFTELVIKWKTFHFYQQILDDDYSKIAFLCADRSVRLHAKYGSHYSVRIPRYIFLFLPCTCQNIILYVEYLYLLESVLVHVCLKIYIIIPQNMLNHFLILFICFLDELYKDTVPCTYSFKINSFSRNHINDWF